MNKKASNRLNIGIIVALAVSLAFNIFIICSAIYIVSNQPLELSAGNYFIAKALEPETIQVDGHEYRCVKPELAKKLTGRDEKVCYGAIIVDLENQEVK